MKKNTFIEQTVNWLDEKKIPYQIGEGADIKISASFKKKQEDSDDTPVILYSALIFLNKEKNVVYAYEEATTENADATENLDYSSIVVKTTDDEASFITIGSILGSISSIASSLGLSFEKTEDTKTASYPPNYIASETQNANSHDVEKNISDVCTNCGAKTEKGKRFCSSCGADLQKDKNAQSNSPAPIETTSVAEKETSTVHLKESPDKSYNKTGGKAPNFSKILISLLGIVVLVVVGIFAIKSIGGKSPSTTPENNKPLVTGSRTDSAVVSSGVNPSDLGNIMNGQYYFSTDKYVFYSSFDENDKAHIYSAKKDGTGHKAIFDGFGWSLVVIDDWLYFSGNQGAAIDGTYNIFRMKLDGSQLEKINNTYSYGMFFYDNYLYYMKSNNESHSSMSICRASLDGSNEAVLSSDGLSPVVYKNQLYYFDSNGNMFKANPDGKSPHVLLTASVKSYVLSDDKIIYFDHNSNIYMCNLDGENNELIRRATSSPVNNINAYDGRIYFSEYDTNFNYSAYGYNYTIKSCKMDGSDEKAVFSSVSYGIYMNLVNNKLMLMDYAINPSSGIMSAYIKAMDTNGANLNTISR